MAVFDSSVLLLAIDPHSKAPLDPVTNAPLMNAGERVKYLIEELADKRETVIVPTPVLCEVLVHAAAAATKYLDELRKNDAVRIVPFGEMAAIEAAMALKDALRRGGHRVDSANPGSTKTKIKFDRQIIAIAKVEEAGPIYSDDDDIRKLAALSGLTAFRTADINYPS